MIRFLLFGLLFTFGINSFAQKQEVDSLIPVKKQWTTKESIQFKTQLSKNRSIGTQSCACGNTDFYYQVYKKEKGQWKLWLDHTEDPEKHKMCECKSQNFLFKDQMTYQIPPITKKGNYQLRINGYNFVMISAEFSILP